MPYITVESGVLSDEQKELLIKRLTEVSSEI
ncbi:MAG TPA: 4-oxalocrotonate tautomerase, partial [Ruminococcus sp.]|nr:4-oxalocrotonate tautomerase [Ruminococcus sp.]